MNSIAAALGVAPNDLFTTEAWQTALFEAVRTLSDEDRDALVRMAEALAEKQAG